MRSMARARSGDLAGAVTDVEAAVEVGTAWRALATVRERLQGPAAALEAWDTAVRLDPDQQEVRLARARARQAVGDLRGALDDLDELLLRRRDPSALMRRGSLRGMVGDFAGARGDFDEAVAAAGRSSRRCSSRRCWGGGMRAGCSATWPARRPTRRRHQPRAEEPRRLRIRGLSALALGHDATSDLERFLALAPPTHPGVAEVRAALERLRDRR